MLWDTLGDLNWLAVLVAAVAYFVLGGLWYGLPPMAKTWMRATGIEVPEGQGAPVAIFALTFVAYLVAATATAALAHAIGSETLQDAVGLGLVIGIGYALTLTAVGVLYDRKPQPGVLFLFNGVFNLLGLVLVAIIVTLWR